MKMTGLMLLVLGMAGAAVAGPAPAAPEIDGATATSAILLLSGALLVIRTRRRK